MVMVCTEHFFKDTLYDQDRYFWDIAFRFTFLTQYYDWSGDFAEEEKVLLNHTVEWSNVDNE